MRFVRRSASGLYVPATEISTATYHGYTDSACGWGGSGDRTSPWIVDVNGGDPFDVSGKVKANNSAGRLATYAAIPDTITDQYSRMVCGVFTDNSEPVSGGLIVRHTGSDFNVTGYYFAITYLNEWVLGSYANGGANITFTPTESGTFGSFPTGSSFWLQAVGSGSSKVVTVYQDGSQLTTHAYSSGGGSGAAYNTGRPGACGGFGTGGDPRSEITFSNWAGGPLNVIVAGAPSHRRGSGYYIDTRAINATLVPL